MINIRNQLKIEFSESISAYWKEKITNITKQDSAKMLPKVNSIFRKKDPIEITRLKIDMNSNIINSINIDINNLTPDQNGKIAIDDIQDKLDVLGAHFASVNNRIMENDRPQLNEIIDKQVSSFKNKMHADFKNNVTICNFSNTIPSDNPTVDSEFNNYFIDTVTLAKIFKKLNNKKSFGLDDIPNIILKHIPMKIIYNYTIIFNNLLNHSIFPDRWKTAKVVALLKKNKDKEAPASYRPISLLPNNSKVFEIIINNRINDFCQKEHIIPDCQFGFRKQFSTIHAINRLTSDINWAFNDNKCVGAVLIDLEKAFDTV